jgi:hypothetical protein
LSEAFLENSQARRGRWRSETAQAKGVRPVSYWTGEGRDALEVAYASSESRTNATSMREIWKGRQGRAAAPLLLVVAYPEVGPTRALVCGPTGERLSEKGC